MHKEIKLLVISDNHGDIKTVKQLLKEVEHDYVVFAGDWATKDMEIRDKFDFIVDGNNDYQTNRSSKDLFFEVGGIKFFLTHGHYYGSLWKRVDEEKLVKKAIENDASVVIYGHTHIKVNHLIKNVHVFNPGSTSDPRDGMRGSYGVITISQNKKIDLQLYTI